MKVSTPLKSKNKYNFAFLDADLWMNKGRNELELALKSQFSKSDEIPRAKNIIIFIGDGMSMTTVTASRIYKGQQKYG